MVLAALAERRAAATQVEIDKLVLAVQWACMHPVESLDLDHLDEWCDDPDQDEGGPTASHTVAPPADDTTDTDPRRLDRRPRQTHHLHLDQPVRLHLRLGHPPRTT